MIEALALLKAFEGCKGITGTRLLCFPSRRRGCSCKLGVVHTLYGQPSIHLGTHGHVDAVFCRRQSVGLDSQLLILRKVAFPLIVYAVWSLLLCCSALVPHLPSSSSHLQDQRTMPGCLRGGVTGKIICGEITSEGSSRAFTIQHRGRGLTTAAN